MKSVSVALIAGIALLSHSAGTKAWNASLQDAGLTGHIRVSIPGATKPPIGHVNFCRNNPADCLQQGQRNQKIKLSEYAWQQIDQVNRYVNKLIAPVSDWDQYLEEERWTYPDSGRGDCEDYVLLKKRELIKLGYPASALLITVVRDEADEGHAVLMVRTNHGDLILDNKHSELILWHETGYTFVKRQSADHPRHWVSLRSQTHAPRLSASGTRIRP